MTFFQEELMQRIRYLHFKIKKIEDAFERDDEHFNLDDINLILEYTKILNLNYRTQNHKEILKDLDITAFFQDPLVKKEIEIQDMMFECARASWVMANAYSQLSEKYEEEEEWENAVIAMTECSKIYKTAAYFSAAVVFQNDIGLTLTSDNLEMCSEEARILAQSIATIREENNNNLYFSSKMYEGLSLLSKRLFYLRKHEEKKKQQIRAQFHYDMGKACFLKARASLESSITTIKKDKVRKLQQKALWYYLKAKDIWEEMLKNLPVSSKEKENIELNLSIVKENLKENDVEQLDYDEIKKIQEEDDYRLKKCQENGVILLQIPDEEILPYEKMQNYIIQEYERISEKTLGNVPEYNWREFTIHENKHAKKFRAYIEEKGGTLLTPYFSAKKEVTILCEKGHQWTTTPDSIYKNNWCPECAGNKKGTTEEYQKIGAKFQCELLNGYVNAKTLLQYKCPKGHTFKKNPYWLKKDFEEIEILCPECKTYLYAKKFQKFVRNKRGQILTPYKGRFKPIKIKCEHEHEWETTPGATYQGRWCKTCANENNPNKMRKESAEHEFLKKIKSINYSLLSKYENNTKQVHIKCQNNHKFTITPKYFKRLVNQKIEPCLKCRKNN